MFILFPHYVEYIGAPGAEGPRSPSGTREMHPGQGSRAFFSTKRGKTDGLGLAVCLGIVEPHGGSIDVDSRPGRGTGFRFALPGTGVEENPALAADPGVVAVDPEGKGWLFRFDPEDAEREIRFRVPAGYLFFPFSAAFMPT